MTRRLLLSGLFILGAMRAPAEQSTFALMSSAVYSTANQFTAGALHITQGLASGSTLTMANLIGGDHFDAQLDVTNDGSLELTYAMTTTTSGSAPLAAALQLTVRAKTVNPCPSRDGPVLYSGDLSLAALGSTAHGLQAGDRQLGPGASEALCFTVQLPLTAATALHDTDASAEFVFNAEQS
jgi:hypothetical protein